MNIKAKPNSMTDQAALDAIVDTLYAQIKDLSATAAVDLIDEQAGHVIGKLLTRISSTYGFKILNRFPEDRAEAIAKSHPSPGSERWLHTRQYLEDSIGRLMEKPCCVIKSGTSVRDTIEEVRRLVNGGNPMTYVYVTDEKEVLQGIVVLRDLMLASPDQTIDEVSIDKPFYLKPETSISDAMQATVRRHFPVYPVCDDKLRLVGTVKGNLLFEEHAFNLSAQSGRMVGVVKEERLHTPWFTSLKYRHPWLQFNLLTAFLAAAVISMFEDTITQLVLLVAFLPVLAGQSGNTGCQSLAITLRSMALDDFKKGSLGVSIRKESILGLANGVLVGITAGTAMFLYAWINDSSSALLLALVVFLAMVGSCLVSSITGVVVPTTLKHFGADPSTASSIFLTTFTDIASLGLFLWCASVIVL